MTMHLIPPATNAAFGGHRLAAWLLGFFGLTSIIPGFLHAFLPDGGAGVIAGLDLATNARQLIAVFAWAGATQIVWGCVMLAVALRYRSFLPPVLILLLIERTIIALNIWVLKPASGGHKPPEAYATLIMLPLIIAALALSLRRPRG